MSNQYLHLPQQVSVSPVLLVGSSKQVEIRRGPSNFTRQVQTASALSNSQIIYNVVLSSPASTIIDSYLYMETVVTTTISATGLTGGETVKTYLMNNFSPRQYPWNSCITTANVQVNNQGISSQPNQYVHALSWFQDFISSESQQQSITPIMPDQAPNYHDAFGSLKNPLLNYYTGGDHYSSSRGEFITNFVDVVNTGTTWTFNWTIQEPLLHPLFEYSPAALNREGLAFVNNFNITLTLVSNLSELFSDDMVQNVNITSIVPNIISSNLIMYWYTTPTNMKLPEVTLRSFNTIVCNQTSYNLPITAGSQTTLQSQSYSFNQIPRKIFIYIADPAALDSANGYSLTNTFFSIQSISVLFNNRSSLLTNLSAADLFNCMSTGEGSRMTYMQSQYFVGSVLCIDPASHLGLLNTEAPGMLGIFNFQIQVVGTNLTNRTITPALWVTTSLDTIMMTTANNVTTLIQGYITPQDVINTSMLPQTPMPFLEKNIYGAGFFDDVKNFFSRVGTFVKDNRLVSRVLGAIPHPLAQGLAQGAQFLGVGANRGGYQANGGYMAGYGSVGGRHTSRAEMQRRALRY